VRAEVAPDDRLVSVRAGAVTFRVLSAGRGTSLVYFHSIHERGGWSPFLDRLARRHTAILSQNRPANYLRRGEDGPRLDGSLQKLSSVELNS